MQLPGLVLLVSEAPVCLFITIRSNPFSPNQWLYACSFGIRCTLQVLFYASQVSAGLMGMVKTASLCPSSGLQVDGRNQDRCFVSVLYSYLYKVLLQQRIVLCLPQLMNRCSLH